MPPDEERFITLASDKATNSLRAQLLRGQSADHLVAQGFRPVNATVRGTLIAKSYDRHSEAKRGPVMAPAKRKTGITIRFDDDFRLGLSTMSTKPGVGLSVAD